MRFTSFAFVGLCVLVALSAAGCCSPYRTDQGALFGGLVGAGTGAIVGDAVGNAGAGTAIGAGIGALTRACIDYGALDPKKPDRYICIERSVENVRVGKKVVPEAEWIQADAFDPDVWARIGDVEYIISNPPFGNVPSDNDSKAYKDWGWID